MNYYTRAFKKYAVFEGRANRAEYWYFFLFNFIIGFIVGFVEGLLKIPTGIYSLIALLPNIAVGVRRMHDINKSGWFLLIPIYNLILLARKGDEGTNRYGDDLQKEIVFKVDNQQNNLQSIFCSKCGIKNEPDAKFCFKCGAKMSTNE